ncbi:MAG: cell division protein ZapA [Tissierellia bacterium]|nr:cell division protein ZapA [Tissierellia bacterium]
MNGSNRIEVIIDGLRYNLVAETNPDKTLKVANYVNAKILSIKEASPKLNQNMAYTLSMMNITGELFDMREKYDTLVEESKEPIQRFRTISEDIESMTKEREDLEASIEKLKDDLVTSLNTISDMNRRYTVLSEENEDNIKTIGTKNKQMSELGENLKEMQTELTTLQKQYQETVKQLETFLAENKK